MNVRNLWVGFALRRLFSLVLVLIGLILATFGMVRVIPGDPAVNIAGITGTSEQIASIRHELLLDRELGEQFEIYVANLARGDLGQSFFTREPVAKLISERVGTSLQLAAVAVLIVLVFAVPLGMLAGALTREGRHKKLEVAFTAATSVIGSLPEFLAATFLAFFFAVWLRLLPVAGSDSPAALVLPAVAVTLRPVAVLARIVRVETLNTLASDFIRTARGKRIPSRLLYMRHVLPNVVTAALTVGGLLFAALVGGAVVVENVFARPGLGTALVTAVLSRDYPVVQGIVLVLGAAVVVVNAAVDVVLALIDPRSIAGKA